MFDDSSSPHARPTAVETPEETPPASPAVQRFHTCRWRKAPEDSNPLEFCSHRDVLPMAGTNGFDAEAWCPDCSFYKVRRVPKKKPIEDYGY
jgi:hypothetical protein